MLNDKILSALNDQIKYELESSYLYLGMAAWLNDAALEGFAHWMRMQAQEEQGHAMKIYDYIEEHGNKVELQAIGAPPKEWKDVVEVFQKSLAHEQFITGRIGQLVELAAAEKDHATSVFLQWFVSEQVEEEDTFRKVLDKLNFVKPSCSAIMFLDKHMGSRAGD